MSRLFKKMIWGGEESVEDGIEDEDGCKDVEEGGDEDGNEDDGKCQGCVRR